MPSIHYSVKSENPNSSIYIRFSIDRKTQFERSTGLKIPNPKKDWSGVIDIKNSTSSKNEKRKSRGKCMPKTNSASNKALHNKLLKLSAYLLERFNQDYNDAHTDVSSINSHWLKNEMDVHFNRVELKDFDYFTVFAEDYHKKMDTYIQNGVKKKYSDKTKNKFKYLIEHIKKFEAFTGSPLLFKQIDMQMADKINHFFEEELEHSINTRGNNFKKLKTLLNAAHNSGIHVNPKYNEIKGFADERIITTLSNDELDDIISTDFKDEKMLRAKHWLIIGCETGQRISDLYRMRKDMIIEEDGYRYIKLIQFKTQKMVKIPISADVQEVLDYYNGDFPPNFYENEKSNRTTLSGYMKEVCKKAGIKQEVKGRLNGVDDFYPKYKLISNHTCRRTFASNRYGQSGWETPQIMEITGHASEKNFLLYIGESTDKFSSQNAISTLALDEEKRRRREEKRKKLKIA